MMDDNADLYDANEYQTLGYDPEATPTTEAIRATYATDYYMTTVRGGVTAAQRAAAFDRWLAKHDAAVQKADDLRAEHVNSRIAVIVNGERIEGRLIGFTHECEPEIQTPRQVVRYSTSCVLRFQFGEVTVPRDTPIDVIEDRP